MARCMLACVYEQHLALFQSQDTEKKVKDIESAVISAIDDQCHDQCGFTKHHIQHGVFKCFSHSPHAVTYRAFIHGTSNATAYELTVQIGWWTSKGQDVVVQRILLTLDKTCAVTLSSFNDEECLLSTTSTQISSIKSSSAIIVGTTIGAVVVFIGICTLGLACLIRNRCKQRIR